MSLFEPQSETRRNLGGALQSALARAMRRIADTGAGAAFTAPSLAPLVAPLRDARFAVLSGAWLATRLGAPVDPLRAALDANPSFVDGRALLDIGPGGGAPLLDWASRFSAVYAFEPNPIARRALEAKLLAADETLAATVALSPIALSDREGPTYIGVDVDDADSGALVGRAAGARHFLIRTMRFDDWASRRAVDLDAIGAVVVDAPDHQRPALLGMSRFLRDCRPLVAVRLCRYANPARIVETLRAAGYAHHAVAAAPLGGEATGDRRPQPYRDGMSGGPFGLLISSKDAIEQPR